MLIHPDHIAQSIIQGITNKGMAYGYFQQVRHHCGVKPRLSRLRSCPALTPMFSGCSSVSRYHVRYMAAAGSVDIVLQRAQYKTRLCLLRPWPLLPPFEAEASTNMDTLIPLLFQFTVIIS